MNIRTIVIFLSVALVGTVAFGRDIASERKADTAARRLTIDEILAKPRRPTVKTPVPPDAGCYVGSGTISASGSASSPTRTGANAARR